MRRYDEPIAVRSEQAGVGEAEVPEGAEAAAPAGFVWRNRLWRVLGVETRWRETADWWSDPGDDLLAESEVWRVVASPGSAATPGVFELASRAGDDGERSWRLRRALD
ncbi:DUF6504 family protein [Nigerium massiliense]|uniref:DUF6504 family protein n=1 Tax=Nigerium massiliense TaxID=1522317 RepID=UPI00058E3799|nr:DUF6504 family protein [Nigerium massiliense]